MDVPQARARESFGGLGVVQGQQVRRPQLVQPVAPDGRDNVPGDVPLVAIERSRPYLRPCYLIEICGQPFGDSDASGRDKQPLVL